MALTPGTLLLGPRGRRLCLELAALGEHGRRPTPAPAEVAQLLDRQPLPPLDAAALLHALVATVDSARYREEPDGEDVLAATPRVGAPSPPGGPGRRRCG